MEWSWVPLGKIENTLKFLDIWKLRKVIQELVVLVFGISISADA